MPETDKNRQLSSHHD